jgi:hypothetical protein
MHMTTKTPEHRDSNGVQPLLISKSRYQAGLQCPKLLWYRFNQQDAFPPVDAATQARFDQGTQVGSLAKRLFPKGIEICAGVIKRSTVDERSRAALPERRPLFEAGFIAGSAFARADVLVPVDRGQWDLVEVKSSTTVKPEHISDMALQRHVYAEAGLRIRRCAVMHVNTEYVRQGEIDARKLLTKTDVTSEVNEAVASVGGELERMVAIIKQKRPPAVDIGPHCEAPYECPLKDRCWKAVPTHSVFTLTHAGAKAFAWYQDGISHLRDIPRDTRLTPAQVIQIRAVHSREAQVNCDALREFLGALEYPLYFLDFETISPAIPVWDGTRPFQQVPFQFSLHIVSKPGAKPVHHGFLAEGTADPRPKILAHLKRLLGSRGSIVAYSATFEKGALRASSDAYPAFAAWWALNEPRVVDLLPPFRSFHYYHPDQCGSASLKNVLPALTDESYEDMEIADGVTASQEFMRITFGRVPAAERKRVRASLEEYCALDTEGMVTIVEKLSELAATED